MIPQFAIKTSQDFADPTYIVEGQILYNNKPLLKPVTGRFYDELLHTFPADISPFTTDNATYIAWTWDPGYTSIVFSCEGFQDKKIKFRDLMDNATFSMVKKNDLGGLFEWWQVIAVVAAIALYKKKNKVGAIGSGDIMALFLLVAGVMGFSVFKNILEFLGVWSSQDTKDLDNEQSNPNSFWLPSFWQNKPANTPWTYVITESQAAEYAEEIKDALGWWDDCEECIKAVFRRFRTKANVSFLAWKFDKMYGEDLLDTLRGGWWPYDGLSNSDVVQIHDLISRLPKY